MTDELTTLREQVQTLARRAVRAVLEANNTKWARQCESLAERHYEDRAALAKMRRRAVRSVHAEHR